MWVLKTIAILFAIAVCSIKESSSYCQPFNKTSGLAELCGYPATAHFTHRRHFIGSVFSLKRVAERMSSCSKYANLIACSVYAPRCESNIEGPYLPCKTVCDEFQRECGDAIFLMGLEWIIGMCQLLPKKDDPNTKLGYLGRCFEPEGFKTNLTEAIPLKCHDLKVPICQDIGYTKTVLSETKQKSHLDWATRKINMHYHDDVSCSLARKRFFCMENFPPCEGNKIGFYCRSKCEEFFEKNCSSPFSFGKDMCMEMPKGTGKNDLCMQDHWPRADNWPHVRNPKVVTAPPTTPYEGGVIKLTSTNSTTFPGTKNPVQAKQESSSGAKVAPIVGGVLAGLCVIAIALGIAYLIHRNQKRASKFPYERKILYNDEEHVDIS